MDDHNGSPSHVYLKGISTETALPEEISIVACPIHYKQDNIIAFVEHSIILTPKPARRF